MAPAAGAMAYASGRKVPAVSELPPSAASLLDGTDLPSKIGSTLLLSTTGVDGWPHLAMLSLGEVVATSPHGLLMALYGQSGSCGGLHGSGRALLLLYADGTALRCWLSVLDHTHGTGRWRHLHGFQLRVEECRPDVVPYAEVVGWIRHSLDDPIETISRWNDQIAWLRESFT